MILGFLQRNEVNSSQAMEKEGLRRCLNNMDDDGLFAETLVTDRHPSIKKYMRERRPETKHYFDVWHVAKG